MKIKKVRFQDGLFNGIKYVLGYLYYVVIIMGNYPPFSRRVFFLSGGREKNFIIYNL